MLMMVVVSQVYTSIKSYPTVYFRYVRFYISYTLAKLFKKKKNSVENSKKSK